MPKITDKQTILLTAAARRDDLSLSPLPETIAGGARVAKGIAGPISKGTAEEREAAVAKAVARSDGDLRSGYGAQAPRAR